MSDDLLTDKELKRETVKEPAKRWANKWRAANDGTCIECGVPSQAGEIFTCCGPYPTKDLAETCAQIDVQWHVERGYEPDEWLGAFPVE